MATIKEAVLTATEWITEVVPGADTVRLEQVTLNDQYDEWAVVLSYTVKEENPFASLNVQGGRLYKVIDLNRDSGEILGLRAYHV